MMYDHASYRSLDQDKVFDTKVIAMDSLGAMRVEPKVRIFVLFGPF